MSNGGRPEIGSFVDANGIKTNYLEDGDGPPVVFIHGSGPGVTAYANWRLCLPALGQNFHVYALDMVGFGYTDRPARITYNMDTWVAQIVGFLDALDIARTHIVGNSFGGALGIALADRFPERVDRLVLMGAVGVEFPLTEGLNAVWGYEPSVENMKRVMNYFAYNRQLLTDELAEVRYRASIEPGLQEAFSAMFPAPRQRWISALVTPEDQISVIPHETLVVHGRDNHVIPLENSLRLVQLIEKAELHVFGRCGHWVQIEWADEFNALLTRFFSRPAR
ncbi:MAG: alpha/beta hydrolase [Actinomycetota bacterium]